VFAISLAQLRAHTSRLLATALAIIIAVGFVVATLVLNQTSKATVLRSVAAQYQNAAVVITVNQDVSQPDNPSLNAKLATEISHLPGVRAVAVDQSTYTEAKLPGRSGFRFGQVSAVAADKALQWQHLTAGRLPTALGEVAVGETKGVKVGSSITLRIQPPEPVGNVSDSDPIPDPVNATATVVGIVDLMGATGNGGAGTDQIFATPSQTIAWGANDPEAIRVAAAAGVSDGALATRVQTSVARNLSVRTGTAEAEKIAKDTTRDAADLTQILLVFATVAVLVCGLVIANTFAVLLAQRTRELALLRCVGATGKQLRRGVLLESLIIGAVASALGVAAGISLAGGLSLIAGHVNSPIPLSGVSVPISAVVIGMVTGIVVTMVAAFAPARRATRVAPLAAMRPQDPAPARSLAGLLRRAAGLALLVPSVFLLLYGSAKGILLLAVGGGAVSFIAVVLLAQWLVPPAVALFGRLAGPSGGVPGRLAASNALRNPQRTAATATALIIGVTLTATMVVGASTTRATTASGLDQAFPTDIVVQKSSSGSFPAGMDHQLSTVPDVRAALELPSALVKTPKSDQDDPAGTPILGIDPARAATVVRSAIGAGVPQPGTISVPDYLAKQWGKDGTKIPLTVGSRTIKLRMHVVTADTPMSMTAADLARLAPKAGGGEIWIKLADGLDSGQRADALDKISTRSSDLAPNSYVQGAFEERDSYDKVITTLLLIVTGLLGIAVIIAIIGVGNTMALSVLERRQESGLLRALGLTRHQLRWMLLWEAVLIAGVASLIGTALGVAYGTLGTTAAIGDAAKLQVDVPWLQLLLIVAVATGAGALASVLPSRRAARIAPVAAIAAT
jgi:putative ABC transport system permease protein